MASSIDIQRLRQATPTGQATLLRESLSNPGADPSIITQKLFEAVARGSVAPPAVVVWLSVANNPRLTVEAIRQSHSNLLRQGAIRTLRSQIRRGDGFRLAWEALGGALGIVQLLADLNVKDLGQLLQVLGSKSSLHDEARTWRRERSMELFRLLDSLENPEVRPIKVKYTYIIPECGYEMARKWYNDVDESEFPGWERLLKSHPNRRARLQERIREEYWDLISQQEFDKVFNPPAARLKLQRLRPFIAHSATFALRVLKAVTNLQTVQRGQADEIMKDLILIHARWHSRRSAKSSADAKFWEAVLAYLKTFPTAMSGPWIDSRTRLGTIRRYRRSLTHYFGVRWTHLPQEASSDDLLMHFLKLLPKEWRLDPKWVEKNVPLCQRYTFLRLVLQVRKNCDIGPATATYDSGLKDLKLSIDYFLLLPHEEAAALFERYANANPGYAGLKAPKASTSRNVLFFIHGGEMESLSPDGPATQAFLLQRARYSSSPMLQNRDTTLEYLRTTELERRRKKAVQGRTPDERSLWARASLRLCVALNDLRLYIETLNWARRFNKDPLTVLQLYGEDELEPEQVKTMFCVLPRNKIDMVHLEDRIPQANQALLTLLTTATIAQREPSFKRYHWIPIFNLFSEIARLRIERFNAVQDHLGWSDEDAFRVILQPTLDLLLEAEKMFLKPENERLGQADPRGLLGKTFWQLKADLRNPIVRFLDILADCRNGLWGEIRGAVNPSVLTLDKPWPRGLPLQHLWNEDLLKITGAAPHPYIQQRAEEVVFCDSETALRPMPGDAETRDAINTFVDDWSLALAIYIAGARNESERKDRVTRSYTYSLGPLTGSRMTPDEAERFWVGEFLKAGVKQQELGVRHKLRKINLLPPTDPGSPTEWDPDPEYRSFKGPLQDVKRLSEVCQIDCMLQPPSADSSSWKHVTSGTRLNPLVVPGSEDLPSFWEMTETKRTAAPGNTIDAEVAAAILYVNSIYGADTSLLMKPFPPGDKPRFPAVYLHQDFLELQDRTWTYGLLIKNLRIWVNHIPYIFLEQLAASIFHRLDAEPDESLRRYEEFVVVIKLLISGDKPAAALPIIKRFVIEHPEASAWHRRLLTVGHMQRLSVDDAHNFLRSISSAVLEELDVLPSEMGAGEQGGQVETTRGIKVTTVKMIAQILKGNSFLDPKTGIDILTRIVQNGKHIDIRVTALDAIMAFMGDPLLDAHILDVLHIHALPIAAALNERRPETETDWIMAEKGGALPTILHGNENHKFLDLLMNSRTRQPELYCLGVEAVQISTRSNNRWIGLFLKKHGFALEEGFELPQVPVYPELLLRMCSSEDAATVPLETFLALRDYVLLLLDPPKSLTDITTAVKKNKTLAKSEDGKHWLHLWACEPSDAFSKGGLWMSQNLQSFASLTRGKKNAFVTADIADQAVMRMADLMLKTGNLRSIDTLCQRVSLDYNYEALEPWEDLGGGMVLRHLIERIDSLRTPEWQADQQRQPHVLPRTLPLRLALLPFPKGKSSDLSKYAQNIIELLRMTVASGRPYDRDYKLIQEHCTQNPTHRHLGLAVRLGSPAAMANPQNPTIADHLQTRIAAKIVQNKSVISDATHEEIDGAKEMVSAWKASAIEEFRDFAASARSAFLSAGETLSEPTFVKE
ncbi:hypothetical protein HJFPF1_13433 [Paramyrothecium foliicola]|nr:hypothetical protein HJFPF1_13433 [Paramyrothecium foliicola]